MRLCGIGLHAYRFVSLKRNRLIGVPYEPTSWEYSTRCKHCGLIRNRTVYRLPRLVLTAPKETA